MHEGLPLRACTNLNRRALFAQVKTVPPALLTTGARPVSFAGDGCRPAYKLALDFAAGFLIARVKYHPVFGSGTHSPVAI
jgi:hypothetical protein